MTSSASLNQELVDSEKKYRFIASFYLVHKLSSLTTNNKIMWSMSFDNVSYAIFRLNIQQTIKTKKNFKRSFEFSASELRFQDGNRLPIAFKQILVNLSKILSFVLLMLNLDIFYCFSIFFYFNQLSFIPFSFILHLFWSYYIAIPTLFYSIFISILFFFCIFCFILFFICFCSFLFYTSFVSILF